MALRIWIAGLLIAAAHSAAAADQSDNVEAVVLTGPGVLTKCRNWLVTTSCHHYHHIRLPERVAVGDRIDIIFGSSPKEYAFPVARIAIENHHCTIYSQAQGNPNLMDKIRVASCDRLDEGR
ncbi:MAG: hypothetical protein JO058_04610 [Alphaproteobacteria bacterium]|nr:hypothetical protein [Alphaproteobacteria bacterium]